MAEKYDLRQAVIAVVGHVDHGKTKLLDKIRGTATQLGEAGGITQAIGASIIPLETVKGICGELLSEKIIFTIPGLLFIDTPGHEAFTTLRKRGGSIADLAIVVIDINDGFQPQTVESVEILKNFKTPFVVALNKIDRIPGFRSFEKKLLKSISHQDPYVQESIDTQLYEVVGKLSGFGFNAERFDRVDDYTKQVAIIPTSAKTGDGIPELLMVITGLAQKFLEESLAFSGGHAKGTVLEVKETKGLGTTLDVIIYDGILKKNDPLIIGGITEPIITKVKALLEPLPLAEMRDKKSKFKPVEKVTAATGVKISAPNVDGVVAGMPIRSYDDKDFEQIKQELEKEINEVMIETGKSGVIIKADSLGSLEALIHLLKERDIPVRKANIGKITKKDIAEAESGFEEEPAHSAILGFNVDRDPDVAGTDKVKIITHTIIYKIIEEYEQWKEQQTRILEAKRLDHLTRPCKLQLMANYVFRQSNPAIMGTDILEGKLLVGTPLMKKGRAITRVKSMQLEQENIQSATKGKQIAMAMDGVTVGRQINEGDILYSAIPEHDFRQIKKLTKYLSKGEIQILKEIAQIMRKQNPVWGI